MEEKIEVAGPTGKFMIDGELKELVDGKEVKKLKEYLITVGRKIPDRSCIIRANNIQEAEKIGKREARWWGKDFKLYEVKLWRN